MAGDHAQPFRFAAMFWQAARMSMDIPPFRYRPGRIPMLISIPHLGTHIPPALAQRMTEPALTVPDTDFNVDRLYAFAAALGCHFLEATHSRYVIDLNRPPDGAALYPGANNTELCPTTTFHEEEIYQAGQRPDEAETQRRLESYWRPYHDKLAGTLAAMKAKHGRAVLFDAHSIASVAPRFFEGKLTDINLGTASGASCEAAVAAKVEAAARAQSHYSVAMNGRFKGGYITRNYGAPTEGINAVQLELSWATYMDETYPFAYRPELADAVTKAVLRPVIEVLAASVTSS